MNTVDAVALNTLRQRAQHLDRAHFDKWIEGARKYVPKVLEELKDRPLSPDQLQASRSASYVKSTIFNDSYGLMCLLYSRGDGLEDIRALFPEVMANLEISERFHRHAYPTRGALALDTIGDYHRCFGMLSFAVGFGVEVALRDRLLQLIDPGDVLFDRVAACFQPGRQIVEPLLYPKTYRGLLDVLDAPSEMKPKLLGKYVKSWYSKSREQGWWDCHKSLHGGGYRGYWCFEAAAVVMAFGIDDSSFCDHEHYPKDLVQNWRQR